MPESKKYAAYDLTVQRFISPPGTKKAAQEAAKAAPAGHDAEVREV